MLGYVGAGGIGVKLNEEALGLFKYERVSIIILFILRWLCWSMRFPKRFAGG